MRKIRYKEISKELESLAKPSSSGRLALGLDKNIGEFYYILVDDLIPYHNQARIHFNDDEIESLSASISMYGVRQPLTVLSSDIHKGKFEVISGERRLRAARLSRLEKVPCIIIEDKKQAEEISIIENIHRLDFHPVELGSALKNLLNSDFINNQSDLAEKLSMKKSVISEHLQYAELNNEVREYLISNNIKSRDILRKVVKIKDSPEEIQLFLHSKKMRNIQNFSIIRILHSDKGIICQKDGILKLSKEKRLLVKAELTKLLKEF